MLKKNMNQTHETSIERDLRLSILYRAHLESCCFVLSVDNSLGLVLADMYIMTNSHCGVVLCLVYTGNN